METQTVYPVIFKWQLKKISKTYLNATGIARTVQNANSRLYKNECLDLSRKEQLMSFGSPDGCDIEQNPGGIEDFCGFQSIFRHIIHVKVRGLSFE